MHNKNKILLMILLISSMVMYGCGGKTVYYQNADDTRMTTELEDDTMVSTEVIETKDTDESYAKTDRRSEECAVYVCGAVVNPGVYYLNVEAIKQDALEAAGGFSEGAANSYVNLAQKISDGEKIYFPYEEELKDGISLEASEKDVSTEDDGKVNLNTATKEQLMTLPGIGESKANAIIQYRDEHGKFSSLEEIKNINGIKDGVYNQIKDCAIVR